MAGFKPPKPFEPSSQPAENWERWKQRFLFYADAIDLETKPKPKQISHLLHIIGDAGVALYNVLPNHEDLDTIDAILDAISKHYAPYRNTTYLRHIFFTECQTEEQTVDDYVMILRTRVKDCEFGELTDSLIKDRLIGGIRDSHMRERLLKEHSMTLDRAINLCRADESSKKQSQAMISEEKIHYIKRKGLKENRTGAASRERFKKGESSGESQRNEKKRNCSRCGTLHRSGSCPAYGQMCHKCKRPNHFAAVCRARFTTGVHAVEQQDSGGSESEEEPFTIDTLELDAISQRAEWLQKATLINIKVLFKLDTGSEVNTISIQQFNKLKPKPKLNPITKRITAYTGHPVPVIGTCQILCKIKNVSQVVNFYVVEDVKPPILGIEACISFELIKRVDLIKGEELTAKQIIKQYDDVFQGMGKLQEPYQIKLEKQASPQIVSARKIPILLKDKVQQQIEQMVKEGILIKEEGPTDWVQPIVIVNKPNGSLRICMDPRHLNKFIKREHYPIPTSEEVFAELGGSTVFTVVDVSAAFWQIPLTEESSKICTIATPFGRYRFTRVPFGIKSAPEILQRHVSHLTDNLEGVTNYMDDILVYGSSESEHNQRLVSLLERARTLNFKFSKDKLQLAVKTIKFLGHQITPRGIEIHQSKIEAIRAMERPKDKTELQRFLGMINFIGKHIPHLSNTTYPLRGLLHKNNEFLWTIDQQQSFDKLKQQVTMAPILAFYDKTKHTTLSVDASQYGLGAVLLQNGQPIAYASVSLSETQMKYPQIEKEFLAIIWGCEHFHFYLYASDFTVETDHRPLLGIVEKPIEKLSPRMQRLLVRFLRYSPKLKHIPGKLLHTADTLSRAPNTKSIINTDYLHGEAAAVHTIISVTEPRKQELKEYTNQDSELQTVKTYLQRGWPATKPKNQGVTAYWHCRNELHEAEGLVFRGDRLVIPRGQRKQILKIIHQAHQGVISCIKKAKGAVYWPGMTSEIKQLVLSCPICLSYSQANQKEPLQSHHIPELPWDKVGVDFGKAGKINFILVTDYHSKFIEIRELQTTTAMSVIRELGQIFATQGLPTILVSDNGPPFDSHALKQYLASRDIEHITSSPYYPQSNGMAEKAVGIAKGLIIKATRAGEDPLMAIMEHNATPKNNLPSPAEMLMGRKIRTLLPTSNKLRKPRFPVEHSLKILQSQQKAQQKRYNRNTKLLRPLRKGQHIMIQNSQRNWTPGKVVSLDTQPRSYKVTTTEGSIVRRNRVQLRNRPDPVPEQMVEKSGNTEPPSPTIDKGSHLKNPLMVGLPISNDKSSNRGGSDERPQLGTAEESGRQLTEQIATPRITRSGRVSRTPARYKN